MIEKLRPFLVPKNTQMLLDYVSKRLGVYSDGSPVYEQSKKRDKHSLLQIHLTPSNADRNPELDIFELQARLVRVRGEQEKKPEELIYWDESKGCIVLAVQEVAQLGYSFDVEDVNNQDEERFNDEIDAILTDPEADRFDFRESPRPILRVFKEDPEET